MIGCGVSDRNPELACSQMYAVKKYYGKTGDNPLIHFVVSFENRICDTATACAYIRQIADFLRNNYQLAMYINKITGNFCKIDIEY